MPLGVDSCDWDAALLHHEDAAHQAKSWCGFVAEAQDNGLNVVLAADMGQLRQFVRQHLSASGALLEKSFQGAQPSPLASVGVS